MRVCETWGRDLKIAWGPRDGVWSTEGELEVSPGRQVSGGWGLESKGCWGRGWRSLGTELGIGWGLWSGA